ncbi:MAG: nucleotidyl transferase AbiEii/AbiGii toxin family protein [Deltaproteobacteria bacterium]|nr:nucleotidyl transferase AbiEii/AbiGii toxin family protein [Deltaproteobacteria bacterium]
MQNLLRLVEQWRRQHPPPTPQLLVNLIREYLQVRVLKAIYHSKYAGALSFMGGTALRICHDLKRFSEDLDFAYDRPLRGYAFSRLLAAVRQVFDLDGYMIEVSASEDKTVQKAFLKLSHILHPLGLSHRETQKVHIKLEVDMRPVPVENAQLESFFVTKFGELFPILKHRTETAFAGKILAILGRTYTKGRDYYDLIWYLQHKTSLDMAYLNADIGRLGLPPFSSAQALFEHLGHTVERVRPELILKDIGRFLEDPSEEQWLAQYQAVFRQLVRQYPW